LRLLSEISFICLGLFSFYVFLLQETELIFKILKTILPIPAGNQTIHEK